MNLKGTCRWQAWMILVHSYSYCGVCGCHRTAPSVTKVFSHAGISEWDQLKRAEETDETFLSPSGTSPSKLYLSETDPSATFSGANGQLTRENLNLLHMSWELSASVPLRFTLSDLVFGCLVSIFHRHQLREVNTVIVAFFLFSCVRVRLEKTPSTTKVSVPCVLTCEHRHSNNANRLFDTVVSK